MSNKIEILRFLRKKQHVRRNTYIIINYYKHDKSWAKKKHTKRNYVNSGNQVYSLYKK